MNARFYAMDSRFLARLQADREAIFAAAREYKTAEAMRAAKDEVMKAAAINLTPAAGADVTTLFSVDSDGVAHIPVVGELTPKAQEDVCGAYTAERLTEYGFIRAAALAAEADPRVEAIHFEMDSPGGYLDGLDQVAQVIAGLSKPTQTNVTNMAASAAYWLASQTDRIVASSPADEIGSIGVAVEWWDGKAAMEQAGYKRMTFTSTDAPNKRPDYATDEGKAQLVASLDATHAIFARRVSKGRGVSLEKVAKDFGRGGMLLAEAAQKVGMIDAVQGVTLDRPAVVSPAGVARVAAEAAIKDQEVAGMDLKDITLEILSKERPDLVAKAEEGGSQKERARVAKLESWLKADADNAKVAEIVAEAKATGKTEADVQAQLIVAVRDGKAEAADPDNAVQVRTQGAAKMHANADPEVQAEIDRMAPQVGVTAEDVAKFGGEKGGK